MLGIDRIGVAQPVLDLGHRKASRPCRARRLRRRLRCGGHRLGPVKLACPGQICLAALERVRPSRAGNGGEALDEARRHRRRAGDLGGVGEDHVARAEQLGKVVRRKTDAALRQIESEFQPHRTAEPGIGLGLRRPAAFHQAAEHDAVARDEACFEQAEDPHAQAGLARPAHDPAGQSRGKQLRIVRRRDEQAGGRSTRCQFVERVGKLCAVGPGESDFVAVLNRQRGQHGAVMGGKLAERLWRVDELFKRLQRTAQPGDQIGSSGQLGIGQGVARVGAMQAVFALAKCLERMGQAVCSGRADAARAGSRARAWRPRAPGPPHRAAAADV